MFECAGESERVYSKAAHVNGSEPDNAHKRTRLLVGNSKVVGKVEGSPRDWNVFSASGFAVAASAVWTFVYLLDLRIPGDRPSHLQLLPVLVLLAAPVIRSVNRTMVLVTALLLANVLYQSLMRQELMVRQALEVLALALVFSLRPMRTRTGLKAVFATVLLFYSLSFATFLATVYSSEARLLRLGLYFSSVRRQEAIVEAGIDYSTVDIQQGGLTFLLHNFGYQLAAGSCALLAVALLGSGRKRLLALSGLLVAILAQLLAGQRSALAALCIMAALIFTRSNSRVRLLVGVVAIGSAGLAANGIQGYVERTYNTVDRLASAGDTIERMQLQLWAVTQIPMYPTGLVGAGESYEAIAPVAGFNRTIAPHNGYLTRTLNYGWLVLLLALPVITRGLREAGAALRLLSEGKRTDWSHDLMRISVSAALVGAMFNALFHNGSVLTFQPDTLLMLFMVLALSATGAQLKGRSPAAAYNHSNEIC